jgi:hypothetical protein
VDLISGTMNMRAFSATVAFAVAALMTSGALAQNQPWLGDRRFGGGMGIRTGNLELHPGVAGEVGYDTNFFQASGVSTPVGTGVLIPPEFRPVLPDGTRFGATGTFNEPVLGVFRFRVTPSLSLSTLGAQRGGAGAGDAPPPKIAFEAALSASYNELIATDAQYSEAVSNRRFVSADLGARLDVLPSRPWGASFTGNYSREVQPVNDPAAPPGYERSMFRAGAALKWRANGGLLDFSLGYDLSYIYFEDESFSNFSSVAQNLVLKGRWLFLPRTALLYTGEYGVLQYPDGGRVKPQGSPLSSLLGLSGLITNRFSALVMAGWKTLFFEEDGDFDSFVGSAELTWYPSPRPDLTPDAAGIGLSAVSLGYRRDARQSYIGNYVLIDGGYLKGSYFIGGNLLISAEASLDHLRRPASYFSDLTRQAQPFSEDRVGATGFAEYRTSDTFGINTTLRYTGSLTDQRLPLVNDPTLPRLAYDDLSFHRFEAWLGVRWFL